MIFTDFLIILAVRLQKVRIFFIEIGHDGYGIMIFKILRKWKLDVLAWKIKKKFRVHFAFKNTGT